MQPLEIFFDFISPYAYLAWTQIHALAARHQRDVVATPVLFAVFLDAYGHKGPAEIPPKRAYIFKDVIRSAHLLGVPVAPPPAHPFNPLLALRCASLLEPAHGAERKRAIDALYRATWGGPAGLSAGIDSAAAVERALTDAGLDGAALVQRATTDDAKARVRAQTQRALEAGVFGVPSMLVDGELFWGLDSFAHIERRLRGEDPVDNVDLSQWDALPSSSIRKAAR